MIENDLAKSMNELKEEMRKFNESSDILSESIKSIEKQISLNVPFGYLAKKDEQKQLLYYLAWDIDEKSRKFRLLFVVENDEYKPDYTTSDNNNIILSKPLIETSLETRIEFFKYIPQFMKQFKNHLKEINSKHKHKQKCYTDNILDEDKILKEAFTKYKQRNNNE